VLVPAYTWVSTASAVSRVGAEPVFVDVHPEYYTLDPEKRLKRRSPLKTKAIIPVHFYGLPAAMPEIMAIALERRTYLVIEDCAQAHGATIGRQKVGTFGDMATFSFYPGQKFRGLRRWWELILSVITRQYAIHGPKDIPPGAGRQA
jgi:dTDP-4-amino-4,6-dideoxygalactose transaminase